MYMVSFTGKDGISNVNTPAHQLDLSSDERSVALIVDDEPAIRELASLVLQQAGFLTLSGCGASAALELSRNPANRIDPLITDVELKDGDGIGLAEEINALRKDVPVLVMSGCREYQGRAAEQDFAFLSKPFRVRRLLETVSRMLPDGKLARTLPDRSSAPA